MWRSGGCGAWWKTIRPIRGIFRPYAVRGMCSYRISNVPMPCVTTSNVTHARGARRFFGAGVFSRHGSAFDTLFARIAIFAILVLFAVQAAWFAVLTVQRPRHDLDGYAQGLLLVIHAFARDEQSDHGDYHYAGDFTSL